jgi:hypothetical protein
LGVLLLIFIKKIKMRKAKKEVRKRKNEKERMKKKKKRIRPSDAYFSGQNNALDHLLLIRRFDLEDLLKIKHAGAKGLIRHRLLGILVINNNRQSTNSPYHYLECDTGFWMNGEKKFFKKLRN